MSHAVTLPYSARATSWSRVLICIIMLLSVVLSPDIEKTHPANSKTSPCVNPLEFNGDAVNCTPSVGSTLSHCVYDDVVGSHLLVYFIMMFSVVLLTDIETTSSKISGRSPLIYFDSGTNPVAKCPVTKCPVVKCPVANGQDAQDAQVVPFSSGQDAQDA